MKKDRRRQVAAAIVVAVGGAVAVWQWIEARRGFDYQRENPFNSDGFIARVQTGIAIAVAVVALAIAFWLWIPRRKAQARRK